ITLNRDRPDSTDLVNRSQWIAAEQSKLCGLDRVKTISGIERIERFHVLIGKRITERVRQLHVYDALGRETAIHVAQLRGWPIKLGILHWRLRIHEGIAASNRIARILILLRKLSENRLTIGICLDGVR